MFWKLALCDVTKSTDTSPRSPPANCLFHPLRSPQSHLVYIPSSKAIVLAGSYRMKNKGQTDLLTDLLECVVHVKCTRLKGKILTHEFALQAWCLATPPPRMIIPVLLAATTMLFSFETSEIKGNFFVWLTQHFKRQIKQINGDKGSFTLNYVQHQAGVVNWEEIEHVS